MFLIVPKSRLPQLFYYNHILSKFQNLFQHNSLRTMQHSLSCQSSTTIKYSWLPDQYHQSMSYDEISLIAPATYVKTNFCCNMYVHMIKLHICTYSCGVAFRIASYLLGLNNMLCTVVDAIFFMFTD